MSLPTQRKEAQGLLECTWETEEWGENLYEDRRE